MKRLIAISACILLMGCGTKPQTVATFNEVVSPTATAGRMCSILEGKYKQRAETDAELLVTFTEKYGKEEAEEYLAGTAYEDHTEAWWEGFWDAHYTCERCLANGDVPERYLVTEEE